jgi:chromosome transmission fidelity protein 18
VAHLHDRPLQFIKARNQGVTEQLVRSATAGMKEADANYLSALTDLFCPMSKKRVKERGLCEADEIKYVERLSHAIEATGVLDRVALGCFEHYANLHRHDATFARYMKANEWLVTYDVLSGTMYTEREYGVQQYLSYTLVPFFPLFQERGGPRVERPKADWEVGLPRPR